MQRWSWRKAKLIMVLWWMLCIAAYSGAAILTYTVEDTRSKQGDFIFGRALEAAILFSSIVLFLAWLLPIVIERTTDPTQTDLPKRQVLTNNVRSGMRWWTVTCSLFLALAAVVQMIERDHEESWMRWILIAIIPVSFFSYRRWGMQRGSKDTVDE